MRRVTFLRKILTFEINKQIIVFSLLIGYATTITPSVSSPRRACSSHAYHELFDVFLPSISHYFNFSILLDRY